MPELIGKGFKRVNESVDPEQLQDGELVTLLNMVLDEQQGVPTSRKDWTRYNTNTIGAGADSIYALHDLNDSAGSNYLLAVCSIAGVGAIYKSLNGTASWSSIFTSITAGKTRCISLGDGYYLLTNGTNRIIIGGTAFAFAYEGFEIPALDSSLMAGHYASGGSLDASSHYEWIVLQCMAGGQTSPPSQPFTTYINKTDNCTTDGSNKKVKFTRSNASIDTRVTSRKIYRTKGLDTKLTGGRIFYYLKDMEDVFTFYDEASDDDLIESDYILFYDVPSKFRYGVMHKGRLFLAYVTVSKQQSVSPPHSLAGTTSGGYTAGYAFSADSITPAADIMGKDDVYKWAVTFYDINGNESSPTYTPAYTMASSGSVNLIGLPLAGAEPYNSPIIARKIYRTKANGSIYYLLKTQYIQTDAAAYALTTYADDTPDASLSTTTLVTGVTQDYKHGIVFSEVNCPMNILEDNIILVGNDEGDEITGVYDDEDGVLIFKKYSIYKLYTSGSSVNWRLIKISEGIGCTEPNCIYKNGNEYFFLSNKTMYTYSPNGLQNISENFKNTLATVTAWNGVTYSTAKEWYILSVLVGSTYYIYVYDKKLSTWYVFTITRAKCVDVKRYGSDAGTILVGNLNYVTKYSTTTAGDTEQDSTPVTYTKTLTTKTYVFGEGIGKARLRKFWADYNKDSGKNIVHTLTDTTTGATRAVTDSTSSGETSFEKITDAMTPSVAGAVSLIQKIKLTISGTGLLKFYGFKIGYLAKKLGKRWR